MKGRHPRLAWTTQAGALAFLVALLVLHGLMLRALPWYMSEFANSPYRAIFMAGGYAFILGLVSLIIGLSRSLPHTRRILVALVLLAAVAPFAFLAATLRVDPGDQASTWEGQLHDWSTIPMFLFLTSAMLVLAPGLRAAGDERLARLTSWAGLVASGAELLYVASKLADIPTVAVAQRLLVATIVAWFLLTARGLRDGLKVGVAEPRDDADQESPTDA